MSFERYYDYNYDYDATHEPFEYFIAGMHSDGDDDDATTTSANHWLPKVPTTPAQERTPKARSRDPQVCPRAPIASQESPP